MKTTRYFDEQVRPRWPYSDIAWCESALADPIRREVQPDGRIRFWLKVTATTGRKPRYVRVVTLSDG